MHVTLSHLDERFTSRVETDGQDAYLMCLADSVAIRLARETRSLTPYPTWADDSRRRFL